MLCDRKTCNEVYDEVGVQIWLWLRGEGEEEIASEKCIFVFSLFSRSVNKEKVRKQKDKSEGKFNIFIV